MPDLTFSEMTFLNARRDRSDEPVQSKDKKKIWKRNKAADTEAEIPRYFASTKARDVGLSKAEVERIRSLLDRYHKRQDTEGYAYLDRSSLPPVELPETPFLGFGSVGGSMVSPVRKSELPLSPHARLQSIQRDVSPTRSSSYFMTGSPSHRSSRHRDKESVPPVPPKRPQTTRDLMCHGSTSQKPNSGVSVSHTNSAAERIVIRDIKSSEADEANFMPTRDCEVRNNPQEQDFYPPLSDKDPRQPQAQNLASQSVEETNAQQPPQTAAVNESDQSKTPGDPLLTKQNDHGLGRPEDLVNASLKLLLEKYGATINAPAAATDTASEEPKSLNAATNDKSQHNITRSVPVVADAGGGESIGEGVDLNCSRSPHPSSRRTGYSETALNDELSQNSDVVNELTGVPLDAQGARHHLRPSSFHPSPHRCADARNAWNGYDSIYQQQLASDGSQPNFYGRRIRDDPMFDMNMVNQPQNILGYDLENYYRSGFDETYNDYGTSITYASKTCDDCSEAQSHQNQVPQEPLRSQNLEEPFYHVRLEALGKSFEDGEHGYILNEDPSFMAYNMSNGRLITPSINTFTDSQHTALDIVDEPGNRAYLPCQRRLIQEEPPRASYSRPHTRDSTYGSMQHNITVLQDQPDDVSLLGFWKPHKLY